MSVRFFYIDESYDDTTFCLSAIAIRHSAWHQCFVAVKNHRLRLRDDFGIGLSRELHAHEFVLGRGRPSRTVLGKWVRSRIFHGLLQLVATLPQVLIFNVCLKSKGLADPQMIAWERLINRIERTMLAFETREIKARGRVTGLIKQHLSKRDFDFAERRLSAYHPRAFLIADEGKEHQITAALRRMHVFNPIPSRYGRWEDGGPTKNIVTERIVEDPFFKKSQRSYFVQLVDCVAFALLKREVPPTRHIKKYAIQRMFDDTLSGVCFTDASRTDPLGIVRN